MTRVVRLRPPEPFVRTIRPPGSKSLTNRALLLAGLSKGRSRLIGWLDADDTTHMRRCLEQLGVGIEVEGGALVVDGVGGPFRAASEPPALNVGAAGTVARFVLAALAASPTVATMDGTPRMRERPMGQLIDALRELGAQIQCAQAEGLLPLRIGPHDSVLAGGQIRMGRPASSQFVSGLAIAGALAAGPLRIVLAEGTPARPYVDMTLATIEAFGGRAYWDEETIAVEPGPLQGREYNVEPDASAASYLLAAAAIYGGDMTIPGLGDASLQGDVGFAGVLGRFGASVEVGSASVRVKGGAPLTGQMLDLSAMPDMTLTAAVVALFASGPTEINGVALLRHHESDRLAAATAELRKLGAAVDEREDGLRIEPPAELERGVEIATYDDHRMAMAFSLAGHVAIEDPDCVAKTYPNYFRDLETLGMVVPVGG